MNSNYSWFHPIHLPDTFNYSGLTETNEKLIKVFDRKERIRNLISFPFSLIRLHRLPSLCECQSQHTTCIRSHNTICSEVFALTLVSLLMKRMLYELEWTYVKTLQIGCRVCWMAWQKNQRWTRKASVSIFLPSHLSLSLLVFSCIFLQQGKLFWCFRPLNKRDKVSRAVKRKNWEKLSKKKSRDEEEETFWKSTFHVRKKNSHLLKHDKLTQAKFASSLV